MSAELRCSLQQAAQGADPIGTAGSYTGVALVPVPLPWPAEVEVAPAGPAVRVQAVVPEGGPAVTHSSVDGPFVAYRRHRGEAAVAGRDVLVCTHGSRDRCCGSFGTRLWQDLDGAGLPSDVTLWRTSHLGGHRFAPTVLVLPEGTSWAWADATLVRTVLDRVGDVRDVLGHYRGCTGLPGPQAQAVERAVLAEVGWALFDTWRHADDLGGGRWRLATGLGAWEATVTPGRRWPVPDCGVAGPAPSGKADVELLVGPLERVA